MNTRLPLWWSRLLTKQMQFALDLLALAIAFALAYLLRFEFAIPQHEHGNFLLQLPFVVLIQFGALLAFGVYSFIWRYIGMTEVRPFLRAALVPFLLMITLRLALPRELAGGRVPLSIAIFDTVLAFGGVLGLRVLRRVVYERYERRSKAIRFGNGIRRPVLLIGAGRAGVLAAKEISGRGDVDIQIKGFIDDDLNKRGAVIQGAKVLGTTRDLPRLVQELGIDHVVITIAEISSDELRRIVSICKEAHVKARIIPGLYEILEGRVEVSRIRDVQVEDLLGRATVSLDEQGTSQLLAGRCVMVTGAGGSIGSELARQVARFGPESLLLVERAEFALFNIDRELRERWADVQIVPLVADIGDEPRMRSIFATHCPRIVIHAAAHKHVPMMEFNASEAIKNNILATSRLGEIAGEHNVDIFVLISTDKAVRPTSIMGASKRVAELVVQDLDERFSTRYVAVRFGNVIGSAGSVVTIFREQILRGGPVTVTHPDMVRYFMTIPEAAQLVLQAALMGEGGEIFILDMGKPVRILDLAKDAITLSGLKPHEDIKIEFTGVRPGEKLFEELQITEECLTKTHHPKIFIGKIAAFPAEKLARALDQLAHLTSEDQELNLRRLLNEMLPEAQLSDFAPGPQILSSSNLKGQQVDLHGKLIEVVSQKIDEQMPLLKRSITEGSI